eukprot:scaffold8191_cov87-Skeletonema_dohrnii-CCMP3373.AAC.1
MANCNGSLRAVDCHCHSVRTIWPSSEELAAVSDASSGHLQRCSDADMSNKCLSRCKRCFYTIMANCNGSLQAVDCHCHSVRSIWPSSEEQAAVSDASSGHLQRCSDADMSNKCLSRCKDASILSWPTVMGHYELWIAIVTA